MSRLTFVIVVVSLVVLAGVAYLVLWPKPTPIESKTDVIAGECTKPVGIVGISERELNLAGLSVGQFALGKLEIKNKPELIEVMAKASQNLLVVDYLICVSVKRGEIEKNDAVQADYLRRMFTFLQSNPDADKIQKWQADHPFPKKMGRLEIPDLAEIGGRRFVVFKQKDLTRPIRFINAGEKKLKVWLEGFPDRNFFPSPNSGPLTITPELSQTLTIIVLFRMPQQTEYPFKIKTDANEEINVAIRLEGNWRTQQSAYATLTDDFTARLVGENSDPQSLWSKVAQVSDTDAYKVARQVVNDYVTLNEPTAEIITGQLLSGVNHPKAALVAYSEAEKGGGPAIAGNSIFQFLMGVTSYVAGKTSDATEAFTNYKKLTGRKVDFKDVSDYGMAFGQRIPDRAMIYKKTEKDVGM